MTRRYCSLITKSPWLLVWGLACGSLQGQWRGETRFEIEAAPHRTQGERTENTTAAMLAKLAGYPLREVQSQWERIHVKAAEESIRFSLRADPRSVVGIGVINDPSGDIFLARWAVGPDDSARGIQGLAIWDTPDHTYAVLNCTENVFQSQAAVSDFLRWVIAWKSRMVYLELVRVWYAGSAGKVILQGSGDVVPPPESGTAFGIEAIRTPSGVALVFKIYKTVLRRFYPDGSIFVQERFPPLAERVSSWSMQAILTEIGRNWEAGGPMWLAPDRDAILFGEAVRRGIDQQELKQTLLAKGPHGDVRARRIGVYLRILKESKLIGQYREVLGQVAVELGVTQDSTEFPANTLFQGLIGVEGVDFSEQALECVARCRFAEGALLYLAEQGTEDTIRELERIAVPASLQGRKAATIERIRYRQQAAKQRL
ncbi:MAG: hypothetical protein JNL98_34375 [Bryobacterales bacterium]|nr:hypothetical protein [Bryobacterales bacterium]